MTRISTLIVAAAITGFGLAAQASVEPTAAVIHDTAAKLAMGAGPDWCSPKQFGKDAEDASGKAGGYEKVARNSSRY